MIILPSAARTASGTSEFQPQPHGLAASAYFFVVTAAASAAGDTLNVRIQHSVDEGTTWADYISFAQIKGNDSMPLKYYAAHVQAIVPDVKHGAVADGTLSAGTANQGPIGSLRRVKWTIVDSGAGTQSFTFSIHGAFV